MKVKFWGVRGSVPTPWADAMQVGGNTSCVQLLTDLDDVIILDAGTGIRLLAKDLIQKQQHRSLRVHLLLSHTHWDHIQGLPFFGLLNYPDNQVTFYGSNKPHKSFEEIIHAQMSFEYFPVGLHETAAAIDFQVLNEQKFEIGPIQIQTAQFNHPGGVMGYRIEYQGCVLVYATDMEYTLDTLEPKLIQFAQGADLLIYDAQYTPEEYRSKQGWGHSSHHLAAELAQKAQAKRLYLFSHDPDHSDQELMKMEKQAQEIFAPTFLAREGLVVDLKG